MSKVKNEGNGRYSFFCPGCDHLHVFYVNSPEWNKGAGWAFNNDLNKPTFSPSLLNTTGKFADPSWDGRHSDDDKTDYSVPPWSTRCHLFVQNGVINFCNDCTHEYNGRQGVEMKDI